MFKKTCKNCGKEFDSVRRDRTCCSLSCAGKSGKGVSHPAAVTRVTKKCSFCGEEYSEMKHKADDRLYCSKKCYFEHETFVRSDRRKRGTYLYTRLSRDRRVTTQRAVMEKMLGGEIPAGHDVHHIDGDTRNNEVSNLALMKHADHVALHMKLYREKLIKSLDELGGKE